LEDDLKVPSGPSQLSVTHVSDVATVEEDAAAGRLEQTHEKSPRRRFSTTGLPNEPESLPSANTKANPVDGTNLSRAARE
jgi:hypothetical protein